MYLTSLYNSDIRLDRSTNYVDKPDVPSVQNFLRVLRGVLEQQPPTKRDICVAFPLQHAWQEREWSRVVEQYCSGVRQGNMSFWHNRTIAE